MAKFILAQKLDDPLVVVKAFHRAIDDVLKLKDIERVHRTGREHRAQQYVYADAHGSTLGEASVILGDKARELYGALFVKIYTPGYHKDLSRKYVPSAFPEGLKLSLIGKKGTILNEPFRFDSRNHWFQAYLCAPLGMLLDYPQGVVRTK
jgi:hypothetical protein